MNSFENTTVMNKGNNCFVIKQMITDYFQETAYRLGYKPLDLLPISREGVEQQSLPFTRGMTQKQKDYYINKKMVTLVQRQNKIIAQVEKEIKKRQLSYKVSGDDKFKLHNPAIIKIIAEHEKIIEKNVKFLDTIHRRKEIDMRRQSVSSNTSSRKNDNQFMKNKSSVSNRSNKSVQSSKSNRSAQSSQSTKERLLLVREREKEKERLKKAVFKQKQLQNSKKSLRAEEQVLKRSQKVKTRSQINKQIVSQNLRDIKYLQNTQIKDHFERLKFKLQKTQLIRAKNAEKKVERYRKSDHRDFKRSFEDQTKKMSAFRYVDKSKTASIRLENQQIIRKQARNYNKLAETLKSTAAKQNREMKEKQQQQFLQALRKNEEQRLQTAEKNRYSFYDQVRLKNITKDVKHQITRKNAQTLNKRRSLESQAIQRKLNHRFQQLSQIQNLKRKLDKQRSKVIKDLSFQRRTINVNNRSKINSFFDI